VKKREEGILLEVKNLSLYIQTDEGLVKAVEKDRSNLLWVSSTIRTDDISGS
jgi:hypothetical protein